MVGAENRADDIGWQERETEEPRRIGRHDALGLGNIFKRQASIREKLIADCVSTDEKTHEAGVGSCGLRPIVDNDPHLLPSAFETSGNGQRCHLPSGLWFLDRLGYDCSLVKAPTAQLLKQNTMS